MPQLDFREALSTPEEKLFSPAATIAPVPAAAPTNQTKNALLRGVGLSRSTWTNIVFVAIASVGGLVCAFYFFNGAEVLRAAAAWPNEFLYPRPLSTDKIDIAQQPNPVDQFSESANGSSKSAAAQGSPEKNVSPANLTEPATTIGTTNPPGVGPLDPGASLISDATSLVSGLNLLPPATDTLFQSFYQTAVSMTPKTTITRTVKNTTSSTRRKVSSTRQKLAPTTKSTASTSRSTQQTANQTQMNTMSAPNQMMTSGGMGGIGGIGGVGAVGGVGGLGGVSGAGLGGGISGTGLGGLGGIIHH